MEETEQEYIDNTQLLLAKIDLDLEKTEDLFNVIAKAIADRKLDECYLVFKYMSKYIEDFTKFDDEEKQWFDFVANRCLKLRKESDAEIRAEGIN